MLKLSFSGTIRKVREFGAGDKAGFDLSICKKNYTKEGEEPTFTWVSVKLFRVHPKVATAIVSGNVISGVGELSLRSYVDKDGNKKQALECTCGGFDFDVYASVQQPSTTTKGQNDEAPPF